MLTKKEEKKGAINEWLDKPWTKLTASIFVIVTLFGIGYQIGAFKEKIDCNLDKINLNQEYNGKLQQQIDDCKKSKTEEYQLSTEDIKRVANELTKRNNEK
jgi:hypothetical protein